MPGIEEQRSWLRPARSTMPLDVHRQHKDREPDSRMLMAKPDPRRCGGPAHPTLQVIHLSMKVS